MERTFTITQAARFLGLHIRTLQHWDRGGKLTPSRTPTNRRLYTEAQLLQAQGLTQRPKAQVRLVYVRVSSAAQRPDLANQRARLEEFCAARGLVIDEWLVETGGGLNFKRPKFLALVDNIVAGRVALLVIAHKDRLARFGFDLVTHLRATHNCELIVMNQETLSSEREMVEDLMAITHCFSARLYGLRNYRKVLLKAVQDDTSPQNQA